jgi:hypothetical protein
MTALGASVAVAAVSIPHAVATGFHLWRLRQHVVRDVLVRFGVLSAAGGIAWRGAPYTTRRAYTWPRAWRSPHGDGVLGFWLIVAGA